MHVVDELPQHRFEAHLVNAQLCMHTTTRLSVQRNRRSMHEITYGAHSEARSHESGRLSHAITAGSMFGWGQCRRSPGFELLCFSNSTTSYNSMLTPRGGCSECGIFSSIGNRHFLPAVTIRSTEK